MAAAAAKLTMMETKREGESGEGCWKMDEAEEERERKIAQEITISPSADRLRTTLNFQVARVSHRAKHAAHAV